MADAPSPHRLSCSGEQEEGSSPSRNQPCESDASDVEDLLEAVRRLPKSARTALRNYIATHANNTNTEMMFGEGGSFHHNFMDFHAGKDGAMAGVRNFSLLSTSPTADYPSSEHNVKPSRIRSYDMMPGASGAADGAQQSRPLNAFPEMHVSEKPPDEATFARGVMLRSDLFSAFDEFHVDLVLQCMLRLEFKRGERITPNQPALSPTNLTSPQIDPLAASGYGFAQSMRQSHAHLPTRRALYLVVSGAVAIRKEPYTAGGKRRLTMKEPVTPLVSGTNTKTAAAVFSGVNAPVTVSTIRKGKFFGETEPGMFGSNNTTRSTAEHGKGNNAPTVFTSASGAATPGSNSDAQKTMRTNFYAADDHVVVYYIRRVDYSAVLSHINSMRRSFYGSFVTHVKLFRHLNSAQRHRIAESLQFSRFVPGEFLMRHHQPVMWMHFIVEGRVALAKQVATADHGSASEREDQAGPSDGCDFHEELGAGDTIGVLEFLYKIPGTAAAKAVTAVKTARINQLQLELICTHANVDAMKLYMATSVKYAHLVQCATPEVQQDLSRVLLRHRVSRGQKARPPNLSSRKQQSSRDNKTAQHTSTAPTEDGVVHSISPHSPLVVSQRAPPNASAPRKSPPDLLTTDSQDKQLQHASNKRGSHLSIECGSYSSTTQPPAPSHRLPTVQGEDSSTSVPTPAEHRRSSHRPKTEPSSVIDSAKSSSDLLTVFKPKQKSLPPPSACYTAAGPKRAASTGEKMTHNLRGRSHRHLRANGEIIFAGNHRLYRFPLTCMTTCGVVIIGVAERGMIIRWNSLAQHHTGVSSSQAVGQSIYSMLATNEDRNTLRIALHQSKNFGDNWDSYVEQGHHMPHQLSFRHRTQLYPSRLMISVVPCLPSAGSVESGVTLLVGAVAKSEAASHYAEEVSRWLHTSLRQQFKRLRKLVGRFDTVDAKSFRAGEASMSKSRVGAKFHRRTVDIPLDSLRRLVKAVESCAGVVERFASFSDFSSEAVNEDWHPVRLPRLLQHFVTDIRTAVEHYGNTLTYTIHDSVPLSEVFLDARRLLQILRDLVEDAMRSGNGIRIDLAVSIVEPVAPPQSPGYTSTNTSFCGNPLAGGLLTSYSRRTVPAAAGRGRERVDDPLYPPLNGEDSRKSLSNSLMGAAAADNTDSPAPQSMTSEETVNRKNKVVTVLSDVEHEADGSSQHPNEKETSPTHPLAKNQRNNSSSMSDSAIRGPTGGGSMSWYSVDLTSSGIRRLCFVVSDNGAGMEVPDVEKSFTQTEFGPGVVCVANTTARSTDSVPTTPGGGESGAANAGTTNNPQAPESTEQPAAADAPTPVAATATSEQIFHVDPNDALVPLLKPKHVRGERLDTVRTAVAAMGGLMKSYSSPFKPGVKHVVEIPLLSVPGKRRDDSVSPQQRHAFESASAGSDRSFGDSRRSANPGNNASEADIVSRLSASAREARDKDSDGDFHGSRNAKQHQRGGSYGFGATPEDDRVSMNHLQHNTNSNSRQDVAYPAAEELSMTGANFAPQTVTTVLFEKEPGAQRRMLQLLWSRQHAVIPVASPEELLRHVEGGDCDILIMDPVNLTDANAGDYDDDDDDESDEGEPIISHSLIGHSQSVHSTSIHNDSTNSGSDPPTLKATGVSIREASPGSTSNAALVDINVLPGCNKGQVTARTVLDALILAQSRRKLINVVHTADWDDWRTKVLMKQTDVVELPKPSSAALVHITLQECEEAVGRVRELQERIAVLRSTFADRDGNRHQICRLLGEGAFGNVYEVQDKLTGGRMAMKALKLKGGAAETESTLSEILAMTSLQHENIIHYFYCDKESDTQLRIYMELAAGGTLKDKIRDFYATHRGRTYPIGLFVKHLRGLTDGIAYVHSQRYVHGDIKTENVLLDNRGTVKIGDFGTAKRLSQPGDQLYVMSGTPQFMAPEVINTDEALHQGYDFKADIWSLGCVALEMATGMPPFAYLSCTHGMGIIKYLADLHTTPDLSPIQDGNPFIYEFIEACLDVDPAARPTAQELLYFNLFHDNTATERATKLVKRAELLSALQKYAAVDSDGGEDEEDGDESGSQYDQNSDDSLPFEGLESGSDDEENNSGTNGYASDISGRTTSNDDDDDDDDSTNGTEPNNEEEQEDSSDDKRQRIRRRIRTKQWRRKQERSGPRKDEEESDGVQKDAKRTLSNSKSDDPRSGSNTTARRNTATSAASHHSTGSDSKGIVACNSDEFFASSSD